MQTSQKITEIVGKPGKVWGNVIIPASGTVTLQIKGDLIEATAKSGFEKTTSWTRIQNIDSVEIAEAPNYLLLAIGSPFVLMGLAALENVAAVGLLLLAIGIICIVFAFREKRRLLIIHSLRYTIPLFMTKSPDLYQQFAATVMAIARQLNAPTPVPQPSRPTQTRSVNSTTSQSIQANK